METAKFLLANTEAIMMIVSGLIGVAGIIGTVYQAYKANGYKGAYHEWMEHSDDLEKIIDSMVKGIGHDKEQNGLLKQEIEKHAHRNGVGDKLHKVVTKAKRGEKKIKKILKGGKKILRILSPFF